MLLARLQLTSAVLASTFMSDVYVCDMMFSPLSDAHEGYKHLSSVSCHPLIVRSLARHP